LTTLLLAACGAQSSERTLTPERALLRLDHGMSAHGYHRVGAMAHVPALAANHAMAHALNAGENRCYEAAAIPVGNDVVEVELHDPQGTRLAYSDPDGAASVWFCNAAARSVRFVVTSVGGAAEYYFIVYEARLGTPGALTDLLDGLEDADDLDATPGGVGDTGLRVARTERSAGPASATSTEPAAASPEAGQANAGQTEERDEDGDEEVRLGALAARCSELREHPNVLDPWSECEAGAEGARALGAADARDLERARVDIASEARQLEHARTLFREGTAALHAGDTSVATTKLREAFDLSERATVLINLAAAYGQQGRHVLSARAYGRYLTMTPEQGVTHRGRRAARRALRVLRTRVAFVRIEVFESGGEARLDDQLIEPWAQGHDYAVEPGGHDLTYHVDGVLVGSASGTVATGAVETLRVGAP
jgi:hypothetical protein